ncbi:MAG: hypothetical protein ABIQ57_18220, partial [Candidatus Kapaibacterium sp.]
LNLFPRTYLTQKALAESALVHQLAGDDEPGYRQDNIAFMTIRSRKTSRGIEDFYFFRYPTHLHRSMPKFAGRESDHPSPPTSPWDVGVSGPFLRSHPPTVTPLDSTDRVIDEWTDSFPDDYMKRDPNKDDK